MKAPQVVDKTEEEIEAIIKAIKETELPDGIKDFIIQCINLAIWIPQQLKKNAITINRLRTLVFGKGYKVSKPKPNQTAGSEPNPDKDTATESKDALSTLAAASEDNAPTTQDQPPQAPATSGKKKPGHGRMPHSVYRNYTEVKLGINEMQAGDPCPRECGGTLREYEPGVLVRIRGQNIADVSKYVVEKLRCDLCQKLFVADIPVEVGTKKYDASFIAMLMLMKYYVAIPFYRQENFQRMLGFPLSDSTQWYLIEPVAGYLYPIFNRLKYYAGNGMVVHNDDTKALILEVIALIKKGMAGKRTGMYTTGIIAFYEDHQIALFINGRKHSGENVGDILKLRDPQKSPVIQMCDALSANVPKALATILCNCLSHGFRTFDELKDFYEDKCIPIISMLANVFEFDAMTRDMSAQERLTYHQENSKPIMDELEIYMKKLMSEKRVEPNCELGKAIAYMQRHWVKLTRFLTVAGAPIENNIVERALKIAIRNRKSSMFYRSVYSAEIGGMITSIIYTCHLAGENPYHYLVALQNHHDKVLREPEQWMPWNYKTTLAQEQASDANAQGLSLPEDLPAVA